MSTLSKDWLTQGMIDFEYKKYVLLAYLQKVKESFGRIELYPFLSELVFHYQNLKAVQENRALLREQFPRELSLEDFKKLVVTYRQLVEDDTVMNELSSIIEFAIPQIKDSLDEGSVIYEYVEQHCELTPVGVTPLYAREGYLFVTQPPEDETNIYRYELSIYEEQHEQLRSLNTRYIETAPKSPFEPYESLKISLTKRFADLPNPAVYAVISRLRIPFTATLMPVAKRLLVKHLSTAA
jgi:hypothetical protein